MMDNRIATPHWKACYSCRNSSQYGGCKLDDITITLDGDDIICEQYENKKTEIIEVEE